MCLSVDNCTASIEYWSTQTGKDNAFPWGKSISLVFPQQYYNILRPEHRDAHFQWKLLNCNSEFAEFVQKGPVNNNHC